MTGYSTSDRARRRGGANRSCPIGCAIIARAATAIVLFSMPAGDAAYAREMLPTAIQAGTNATSGPVRMAGDRDAEPTEPVRIQLREVSNEDASLGDCKEFIPIATQINTAIVDRVRSPRPTFKCSDFGRIRWDGSGPYSIIRVSNSQFCHERYCFTAVFDDRAGRIAFAVDAENLVDRFRNATEHIVSLNKILNHKIINSHDGVILTTRRGSLAISVVDDVLTISIAPETKGK